MWNNIYNHWDGTNKKNKKTLFAGKRMRSYTLLGSTVKFLFLLVNRASKKKQNVMWTRKPHSYRSVALPSKVMLTAYPLAEAHKTIYNLDRFGK